MTRSLLALVATAAIIGCASQKPSTEVAPQPAPVATTPVNVYGRLPNEIAAYKLTARAIVTGTPSDSLFRFSDGARTLVTVIIYDLSTDVKVDADSQKWTARGRQV
jgi:hypothetical protein